MKGDLLIWCGPLLIGGPAARAGSTLGLGRRCRGGGRCWPERGKAPWPCLTYSPHQPHIPDPPSTPQRSCRGSRHRHARARDHRPPQAIHSLHARARRACCTTLGPVGTHSLLAPVPRTQHYRQDRCGAPAPDLEPAWPVARRRKQRQLITEHAVAHDETVRENTSQAVHLNYYTTSRVCSGERPTSQHSSERRGLSASMSGEHPCRAAAKTMPRDPDGTQDERSFDSLVETLLLILVPGRVS
ncbi:uncharacterized protein CC84DRAFT_1161704 [Paraphaeosphaeria sporulosa]|uniref:Uncharacterized protein n=1 Tax=Paraphaeosphaeria sporulosa TaxID=1460663 RepID=A0A177CV42_9PLEO|nr:uncharacterized protein CC84DRAFT_1161704 [Paraphaeosphaeria sporulosa]OAG10878.1 hypothetical protein CC84DRAFT_1161704 [Paraphaeosphaeria sporulosa]